MAATYPHWLAVCILAWCFVSASPHLARGQHFTDCLSTASNATILIPEDVSSRLGADGSALAPGDEVAVFTDDGDCAGARQWDGSSLALAAAGSNDQETAGFAPRDAFSFKVWDASAEVTYQTEVTYESCGAVDPLCRDDGHYQENALFSLSEIRTAATLPVELTTFDVTADGSSTVLRWETTLEIDNAGFEVQHRPPNAAPEGWTTAGFVEGNGSTTETKQYSYRLDDLVSGTHTFRLKQVDRDGSFEYSESVEVGIQMTTAFELEGPYPNPFRQQATFSLRVAESQRVDILAYNQLGQHVATLHSAPLEPNTKHVFTLAGQRLASGIYFIRIQGTTFNATKRATLVR